MMKKRIILWLAFLLCIAVPPGLYAYENFHTEISANKLGTNPPYIFTLDPGFTINQNINQQGLVVISGNLKKNIYHESRKAEHSISGFVGELDYRLV
jgi:hypothetical protein